MAELRLAVERLSKGVPTERLLLRARNKFKGRLAEEENLDVYAGRDRLLSAKFFYGRKPYYFPWVELFTVNPTFFGSHFEPHLLRLISANIGQGGRIFVEYEGDDETREGLISGIPAPATRLGYLLFIEGFTWFKDWYFAEGFYEGDIKLQGEKPTDRNSKKKHHKEIKNEMKEFIARPPSGRYVKEGLERAQKVLKHHK